MRLLQCHKCLSLLLLSLNFRLKIQVQCNHNAKVIQPLFASLWGQLPAVFLHLLTYYSNWIASFFFIFIFCPYVESYWKQKNIKSKFMEYFTQKCMPCKTRIFSLGIVSDGYPSLRPISAASYIWALADRNVWLECLWRSHTLWAFVE